MKTKPIINQEYTVISGPRDKPNDKLKVRVLRSDVIRPGDVPLFYQCEVVEGPRTGDVLLVHYSAFEDTP